MVTTSDVGSAAETAAARHPLVFLARHYAIQAAGVLSSFDHRTVGGSQRAAAREVVARQHTLIVAKTYRALTSEHQAKAKGAELLADALGSAKEVLVSIERSLPAWHTLAGADRDARIAGLIELLEALRTGVELRFPDAHAFVRPGLDDGTAEG